MKEKEENVANIFQMNKVMASYFKYLNYSGHRSHKSLKEF